jgi:hypothetical protein
MSVKWCRPFYDGMGKPLLHLIVTLRDVNGAIIYTCTELRTPGYAGCYTVDIAVSDNYWIWYQPEGSSKAIKLQNFSPVFIPADDLDTLLAP